ncbi:MAG TPA: hypothetical protein O0Y13_02495, partial [Methanocorpusculum sp.]|nr:hypothetical protein [Methanocorpusculum sp.]
GCRRSKAVTGVLSLELGDTFDQNSIIDRVVCWKGEQMLKSFCRRISTGKKCYPRLYADYPNVYGCSEKTLDRI